MDDQLVKTGKKPTYRDISRFLDDRGISLSRARWQYLLAGRRETEDDLLIDGLASYFDVSPAFLRGESEPPAAVSANFDRIAELRTDEVRVALRALRPVDPDTMDALLKVLNQRTAPAS